MSFAETVVRFRAGAQARRRLDETLSAAPVLEFDDDSRLVFFSDLHRGDNGPADAFRYNRAIFLSALGHYEREGYTYVEVGDGDELWKNRNLAAVQAAHRPVFRILDRFRAAGRLFLLAGNHQLVRQGRTLACFGPEYAEALLLRHQARAVQLLVTHGHQADATHARPYGLIRLAVRYVWRHLQNHGLSTSLPQDEEHVPFGPLAGAMAWSRSNQAGIERRIAAWLESAGGLGIICGHTHRAAFALAGALPYYNTGCGIRPGVITGLEIVDGAISLVSWTDHPKEGPGAMSLACGVYRTVLAGPQPLG